MKPYWENDPDSFKWSEAVAVGKRIIVFLGLVYTVLAVGAHYWSLGMIFPQPPIRYELTSDCVQLVAPDGVKLAARHWACPGAKFTLLYLHGNFEDLGRVSQYAPKFVAQGFSVFSFDYRHYGHSGGTPTEANTYADAQLAYDYMRTELRLPAERIVIFGYSVGSGPAVELALHRPAAGLVLQSAFVSTYRTMIEIPLFPGDKFHNLSKVGRLHLPVFFIHGVDDTVVPFWHAESLYEATTARKAKFFVPGGQHGGLAELAGPLYWAELKKFTDSL